LILADWALKKLLVPVIASILILGTLGLSQDAFSGLPPGKPTIKITKETIGGDGAFFFTIFNATNPADFTTVNIPDTSINSMTAPLSVQAGSYSVTETVPLNWTFISSDCLINDMSQGSTLNFNIINGDTVECIFVNDVMPPDCGAAGGDSDGDRVCGDVDACPGTPGGTPVDTTGCALSVIPGPNDFTIKITKETIGGDGAFFFNIFNATNPAQFNIGVNIPDTSINSMTVPIPVRAGTLSVTETVSINWNLISSECRINGELVPPIPPRFPPLTFNTISGDTVECIFENLFVPPSPPDDKMAVGGELIPLDTTMVLLAGSQTTASWMIPVIVSGIGIGIVVVGSYRNSFK